MINPYAYTYMIAARLERRDTPTRAEIFERPRLRAPVRETDQGRPEGRP
ncbi:hypothetical protein [Anianabacter salinae]|nr:hypothetical protein [Anianabacter salinae]MBV0910860.1 hypothetical protein [Anianabacter salinae]